MLPPGQAGGSNAHATDLQHPQKVAPDAHVKNWLLVPQLASGNLPYSVALNAAGLRFPSAHPFEHGSPPAQHPTNFDELVLGQAYLQASAGELIRQSMLGPGA